MRLSLPTLSGRRLSPLLPYLFLSLVSISPVTNLFEDTQNLLNENLGPFSQAEVRSEWIEMNQLEPTEVCVPSPAECTSAPMPQGEFKLIEDIHSFNWSTPGICVTTPLRALARHDNRVAEAGFPLSVNFHWRAPIFHHTDRLLQAFLFSAQNHSKWAIGGNGSRDSVWNRYRKSASHNGIQPLSPHFEEFAEVEPYLMVIRDAVTGVNGIVADCNKNAYHFSMGSCYNTNNYMTGVRAQLTTFTACPGLWNLSSPNCTQLTYQVQEKIFVLRQVYGNEYYHFIIECATRLFPWRHLVVTENMKVIVNVKNWWTGSFLRFMGVLPKNIISTSNQIVFSKLVYLPTPNPCLFSNAIQLRGMRGYIHSRLVPVPAHERILLLISRLGTRRQRHIVNEEGLVKRFRERFPHERLEIFSPNHSIPLEGHFQLFHRAKIVIGPHGGGFANLIACKMDTKVIEITNNWGRNFFPELAAKLNLEFHMTMGEAKDDDKDSPITVDVEEITDLVGQLLEEGYAHLRSEENIRLGKEFYFSSKHYPVCCYNDDWV